MLARPGLLVNTAANYALKGSENYAVTYKSTNVCALRESMGDINCTYEFPYNDHYSVTPLWFTKGEIDMPVNLKNDADYAGRVETSCGTIKCNSSSCNGTCTLRIKDLRQTDSAEYKFRFITNIEVGKFSGVPGVMLSVTDQVKVSFPSSTDPTRANMTCCSMCNQTGGFTYTWFRNGQYVEQGIYYKGNISSEDNYSCAAKGYKHLHSPLVYAPKTPLVTVSPSGKIKEGSSVTLSCSSDANPAADYTWFKEHDDSVGQSGQNYTITNITSELGGNYYCQPRNAIGHHNSTFLFIRVKEDNVPEMTSSSQTTAVAVGTIGVLLATILLLVFLWMRTKRASRNSAQGGRPNTVEEKCPVPLSDNVSALTIRSAPAAQREPIEDQDDLHYASVHISHSRNQEVPRCLAGSCVQSDQPEGVLYSAVNFKKHNTVPEACDQRVTGETSELYSTVKKTPQGLNQSRQ
ncbi:HEPACAM family member 2-like isoform X4 [Gadus chalcogrammus]|uniref:HEPACAM family member 2-like isoform X4 n=1 Tax=Gadus chalcogrammus TaxID=1042646 RepID=UPI0024C27AC6|nr:HEPACAM family member 2-like isoform X4 [Gadus chalcogrammus]